jgi:hypothetical protein
VSAPLPRFYPQEGSPALSQGLKARTGPHTQPWRVPRARAGPVRPARGLPTCRAGCGGRPPPHRSALAGAQGRAVSGRSPQRPSCHRPLQGGRVGQGQGLRRSTTRADHDLHDDENYYILEPRHSPHGGPPTIVPLGPGKLHCDVSGFRFDVPTESIADFLERFVTAMEADKTWDRAWDKVRGRGA